MYLVDNGSEDPSNLHACWCLVSNIMYTNIVFGHAAEF